LAVGDVGEASVGQLLGQRVDAGKAVDPPHALFGFERAVGVFLLTETAGLAHPGVGLKQPEGDALGGDEEGRMQIQPPTALVVRWPEVGDALLAGVVELGGVLQAQYPGMRTQERLGAGDVRGEHALGAHLGMVEQAVGGAGFAPAPAGGGNAHRRFVPQCAQEPAARAGSGVDP
jgi:hypothetical protein